LRSPFGRQVSGARLHRRAPLVQRRRVDEHVDCARGDVDPDPIAFLDEADGAALARLG
jgi:hypothetical protein